MAFIARSAIIALLTVTMAVISWIVVWVGAVSVTPSSIVAPAGVAPTGDFRLDAVEQRVERRLVGDAGEVAVDHAFDRDGHRRRIEIRDLRARRHVDQRAAAEIDRRAGRRLERGVRLEIDLQHPSSRARRWRRFRDWAHWRRRSPSCCSPARSHRRRQAPATPKNRSRPAAPPSKHRPAPSADRSCSTRGGGCSHADFLPRRLLRSSSSCADITPPVFRYARSPSGTGPAPTLAAQCHSFRVVGTARR